MNKLTGILIVFNVILITLIIILIKILIEM
jgi:hypothetical protein